MQTLIQEGKVRYGGLSNHTIELMQRAMTVDLRVSILPGDLREMADNEF